jgi:hypothetical protein
MTTSFGYMVIIIIMWVLYYFYYGKAPVFGWDNNGKR